MAFKVSQADEDVGVHNGPANLCFFYVFPIFNGYFYFIGTAQAVADDDLTARRDRVVAVQVGTVQMFQGMLAAARIEGITVRQERFAAQFLHQVGYGFDVLRADRGQAAQFAEVHFDGHELAIHVDLIDTGTAAQFL